MQKVKSVLELSKYQIDQTVHWVVFRPVDGLDTSPENCEPWMRQEHPKVFFDRKIMTPLWKFKCRVPRLHSADFLLITQLLTQRPVIEEFVIKKIRRSHHTGEFTYMNDQGECMPEAYLFASRSGARKELSRLQRMLTKWMASFE